MALWWDVMQLSDLEGLVLSWHFASACSGIPSQQHPSSVRPTSESQPHGELDLKPWMQGWSHEVAASKFQYMVSIGPEQTIKATADALIAAFWRTSWGLQCHRLGSNGGSEPSKTEAGWARNLEMQLPTPYTPHDDNLQISRDIWNAIWANFYAVVEVLKQKGYAIILLHPKHMSFPSRFMKLSGDTEEYKGW